MKSSLPEFVRLIRRTLVVWFVVGAATVVQAAPAKIFVASYGNDANSGSPASPKRAFQAAHNAVAPGGEIVALDTAGYGPLAINKSVSVIVPPGATGFGTVSGHVFAISINAAPSDVVSLRGLIVENTAGPSGYGIRSDLVGKLIVEDCAVRNFSAGITFVAPNAGHLQVHGGSVRQNTTGIFVQPFAAVPFDAIVTDCLVENNNSGIDAAEMAHLTAANCTIAANTTGVISVGANTKAFVENCRISNNSTGIFPNGGEIISLGNNAFTN